MVIEFSSKREERIKQFARAAEKTESVRSSSQSKSKQPDISDDRSNQRAYLGTDSHEEKHPRRRMENQDRHAKEKTKIKKSK